MARRAGGLRPPFDFRSRFPNLRQKRRSLSQAFAFPWPSSFYILVTSRRLSRSMSSCALRASVTSSLMLALRESPLRITCPT